MRRRRIRGKRSKFELEVAKVLPKGTKYEQLKLGYTKKHKYVVDFELPSGIILECKGEFKAADRKKHLLLKEQHPDRDIRFVFMRADNKLNKNSDTTYGEWCDKYGFRWSQWPELPL